MKTNYILLLAAAAALAFSCAKEKEGLPEEQAGERVTIKVSHGSEWDTKVSMTEASDRKSMSLAWESTDKLSVNGEEFTVKAIVSAHEAEFEGTSPGSGPYTIIYPGKYADAAAFNARSYAGQKQTANASTAHLEYNAMLSGVSECAEPKFDPAWAAAKGGSLQQNGVIHLLLQLPDAVTTVNAVTLAASRAVFPTTNAGDAKVSEQTLSMNGVVPNNRIVEAYMMFSAAGVEFQAGDILTVAVDTPDAMYYRVLSPMTAQTWTGGGQYTIQCKVITENNFEINNVSELEEFRDGVNSGSFLWQHCHATLNSDINCSGISSWTPIGAVTSVTNANYAGGYSGGTPFRGVFNGGNHTIQNFKPAVEVADKGTFGLFGVLEGAAVKDLNIDTDLTISAKAQADAGVLVGTAISSTIKNVTVSGKITSAGTETNGKRFALGGIVGFVFNTGDGTSLIKDCTTNLVVNADCGSNTGNGAAGAMYGGVAGFVTTSQDNSANNIENCVNSGEITAKLARCSGIVATANYGGHFLNCTNNANQVNSFSNGRIGNVVSVLYKNAVAEGLVNNGNLTVTQSNTHAGAIVCLFNDGGIVMKGGRNTGTILAAISNYRGLLGANLSSFKSISDVTVGGKLGTYKADGNHEMIDVNAGNYTNYIGVVSNTNRKKITGLTWNGE